ncbi:MAG TPA: guanylyltransferase [Microscillaceae bacterium]|nr:guanylyltransferase [Microscillaceae bacterium]
MKFDELDAKMRVFETAHDFSVLPHMYIVARLDGRGFTKLTKETLPLEAPFDPRFRDYMVATTSHLMTCGFKIVYGYTESDEISLLFAPDENTFGRKTRKLNSVLAGEASAKFVLEVGQMASFDCRISQLPRAKDVVDYFRWRNEDAHRNALNAHCYWTLRKKGASAQQATKEISGLSIADKNELLFQEGINFNDVPQWQKRGIGIYWQTVEKEGFNPKTQQKTIVQRQQLYINMELPMKEAYSEFVQNFLP